MTTKERLFTADDLLNMPDDGRHYELIEGELIEVSPTNEVHGVLAAEILMLIGIYIRSHKLGRVFAAETGFTLFHNPDTTLAPDVAYLSNARAKPLAEKFGEVSPDLAIEVVSPSNSAEELNKKTTLYFAAGTRQVWIIYPKTRTMHVYESANKVTILGVVDTLSGNDLLPAFTLKLSELFAVLDN